MHGGGHKSHEVKESVRNGKLASKAKHSLETDEEKWFGSPVAFSFWGRIWFEALFLSLSPL